MAMTLNEARLQMAQACTIGGPVPPRFVAGWLEAINAHLTQPAQAVDVVYSEGVCGDGAAILRNGEPMRVHEIVAALNATRALAGEQAGWRVPVTQEYTTGHCENHKAPGGCQLHNLQCGWPKCDRQLAKGNKDA